MSALCSPSNTLNHVRFWSTDRMNASPYSMPQYDNNMSQNHRQTPPANFSNQSPQNTILNSCNIWCNWKSSSSHQNTSFGNVAGGTQHINAMLRFAQQQADNKPMNASHSDVYSVNMLYNRYRKTKHKMELNNGKCIGLCKRRENAKYTRKLKIIHQNVMSKYIYQT